MTQTELLESGLLTVEEAARFLSLSRSKIYSLMDDGKLPYVKIDRARRIPRQSLVDLAEQHLNGAGSGN